MDLTGKTVAEVMAINVPYEIEFIDGRRAGGGDDVLRVPIYQLAVECPQQTVVVAHFGDTNPKGPGARWQHFVQEGWEGDWRKLW